LVNKQKTFYTNIAVSDLYDIELRGSNTF